MGLLDRVKDRGPAEKSGGEPAPSATTSRPASSGAESKPAERAATPLPAKPAAESKSAPEAKPVPEKRTPAPNDHVSKLKIKLHGELIDRLDLSALGRLSTEQANEQIRVVITQLLDAEGLPLSREDRKRLEADIASEVLGFGPLDALLKDELVTDILVNRATQTYAERGGKLQLTDIRFRDDEHLIQIIDRIVSKIGRRIDTASPLCDARLPDGSRVNAVIPPIAIDGPSLSIRKFGKDPLRVHNLIEFGSMTEEIATFCDAIVRARMNIVISGGTGSGKTTLLNCCSSSIPEDERVVTIEDAAEIQLQQPHVVRLETRPPNLEGKGEVTCRDLVKNALRMRPERIVVGEIRGGEAMDMLQAMNTGHDGSLTTLHANSPRDSLSRLEMMILMSGVELPVIAMRQQISSAVNFVLQQSRLRDGSRRVMKVTEIVGMEGDIVSTQDIFEYKIKGINEEGKVIGHFECTGIRPSCVEQIQAAGIHLPPDFFTPRVL